ncbi:hypothetical protein GWK75_01455 [Candidatus Saccharibacteria bacterium oral taxon 955]|nr:hypothetical protein GWK75_01455 [Candidatus Saccharibacteria bacterium oral taxon 955]
MLQVASGFSAIVNGGIYHMPTVIAGSIDQDGQFKEAPLKRQFPGVISASSSATIREMVHQAHYATYNPKETVGAISRRRQNWNISDHNQR